MIRMLSLFIKLSITLNLSTKILHCGASRWLVWFDSFFFFPNPGISYRVQLTIVAIFTPELNNRYSVIFVRLEIQVTTAVSEQISRLL